MGGFVRAWHGIYMYIPGSWSQPNGTRVRTLIATTEVRFRMPGRPATAYSVLTTWTALWPSAYVEVQVIAKAGCLKARRGGSTSAAANRVGDLGLGVGMAPTRTHQEKVSGTKEPC